MVIRILASLFICFAWINPLLAFDQQAAQWIVVTPPAFREALKPLVDHREAEGLKVAVVETSEILKPEQIRKGDAEPLKEQVQKMCRDFSGPNYVLLVGAALGTEPDAEKTVVPTLRGTIGRMKGEPTDHGYGCLGNNLMPTVAVGRFPARSAEEVRQMVQKTLKREGSSPGACGNRLAMLVGNPGGNSWLEKKLVDAYVQNAATERLGRIHPLWDIRAIVHSAGSPFCIPNDDLQKATLKYLQEGQYYSFYLGHSYWKSLWSDGAEFMNHEAWEKLKIPAMQGVFFTCGCFACQLSGMKGEGYGLAAMRNPDGPSAVIGAYAESYAAMGQLALDGMLKRFSAVPTTARLADYWLDVQAGLARGAIDPVTFQMLDQADGAHGKTPLAVQRQEHLEMWTLLGDPAMRLTFPPSDIKLEVAASAAPGERFLVKGVLPNRLAGATVRITLRRPVDSMPRDLEALPDMPAEKRARVMTENHRRANEFVLATHDIKATGNAFECELEVPGKLAADKVVVQAYTAREKETAYGLALVTLKREEEGKTSKPL